jgi:endonuclease-3 related protein
VEKYGNVRRMKKQSLAKLKQELLNIKGIGPETADSILLYALEKPVFVIDEYTRRLLKTKRLSQIKKYDELRELFEKSLPRDWRLYQDFHALIVIDGENKT